MFQVKYLKKFVSPKKLILLIFALYFLLGMLIYTDYGISTDELIERRTSLANYIYVMEVHMSTSDRESIQNVLYDTPELIIWRDRFYGAFLQTLTVFIEHINRFEMTTRDIFLMRHAFTFINYFIAGIFFYLILQRRFGNSYIPLIGTLFFILSPRFFGESFFNIKDILFYSWCIIASYFVLRWLEDEKKKAFLIPAAITLAIATNTRILGVSILLLAGGFVFVQGMRHKAIFAESLKRWFLLCGLSFLFYIIITPFMWENPLKNSVDTFFHFLRFDEWDGRHFYLGEMITRNVPWHYIPVWMSITIPIMYIAMFLVGIVVIATYGIKLAASEKYPPPPDDNIQQKKHIKPYPHLYDLFFTAMFVLTLLGFIVLGIGMYEGWRHAYNIYLPFLYLAVCGLALTISYFRHKQKWLKIGFSFVVAASLLHSSVWIIVNHPYQYVYFNVVGRQFAERNFTLDYWNVSHMDLVRYALDYDDNAVTTIYFPSPITYNILTEAEKRRITRTEVEAAEFYIQGSRVSYAERVRGPGDGFRKIASITVDGMTISSLWQRILPHMAEYDFKESYYVAYIR